MARSTAPGFASSSNASSGQAPRYSTTLLSSEAIYRHVATATKPRDPDAWFEAHRQYLSRLAEHLDGFACTPILYLRQPHNFAVSLFKEAVAKARPQALPDFEEFVGRYTTHFDYPRHIAALTEFFGEVDVRSYESAAKQGLIPSFYASLGIDPPPDASGTYVRRSLSNRATLWLHRTSGQGSKREQRRRILYADRDPDGIFREETPSTLWPSPEAYAQFAGRLPKAQMPPVVADAPPLDREPTVWTADMQADADRRFREWHDSNLASLRYRELLGKPRWIT